MEHKINPENWVHQYREYLFNYAITRVGDVHAVEDLVQETFYAGLNSAKNFKGKAAERTWLVSILKRKVIDFYRKKNTLKGKAEVRIGCGLSEYERDWLEEFVADMSKQEGDTAIEIEELSKFIEKCIEKLPEKQCLAFRMKTIRGMSTEDICKELNMTPGTYWVLIHRARTKIRNCLKQNWFS
ncbi:MAG: sigma-70 family RNA polymerase sigma factor [Cyanobacteria bacterium P01_A01_bin.84]